jgi:hypothetical protein
MAGNLAQAAPLPAAKSVLLFFGSPEILGLLSFSIESRYYCKVAPYSSVAEAVQAFQASRYDLVILDSSLVDGMIVFEQAHQNKIPFVLFHPEGKSPEVRGPKIKAHKESELLEAVRTALEAVQCAPREAEPDAKAPFVGMSVRLLRKTNPQSADLYVKLSELKFVKLFHEGSVFTAADEETYATRRKIDRFYVRLDGVDSVVKKINGVLESLLHKPKAKPETAPLQVDTVETIHELARHIGFTPEVQKLVKNNMNLVVAEMQATPSLAGVLKNMERNKDKYIAAHSQMLAEVSCALAIAMEWGSEMSLKKITMAALLHDMCLTDNRLAAVQDLAELKARKDEFDSGKQEEYQNHTKKAAILIQGMKEVPADVDKIVYQHHELPRGTGFPEAIGHTHIHPLAATMMVSHDLVTWLINHPGPLDKAAFLAAHADKYAQGSFKKLMKAIQDLQV